MPPYRFGLVDKMRPRISSALRESHELLFAVVVQSVEIEFSKVAPLIIIRCGGGWQRHCYLFLVEQSLNQQVGFWVLLVLVEYELDIGCHREDARSNPAVRLQTIYLFHLHITAVKVEQARQWHNHRFVTEAEGGSGVW